MHAVTGRRPAFLECSRKMNGQDEVVVTADSQEPGHPGP